MVVEPLCADQEMQWFTACRLERHAWLRDNPWLPDRFREVFCRCMGVNQLRYPEDVLREAERAGGGRGQPFKASDCDENFGHTLKILARCRGGQLSAAKPSSVLVRFLADNQLP